MGKDFSFLFVLNLDIGPMSMQKIFKLILLIRTFYLSINVQIRELRIDMLQ